VDESTSGSYFSEIGRKDYLPPGRSFSERDGVLPQRVAALSFAGQGHVRDRLGSVFVARPDLNGLRLEPPVGAKNGGLGPEPVGWPLRGDDLAGPVPRARRVSRGIMLRMN